MDIFTDNKDFTGNCNCITTLKMDNMNLYPVRFRIKHADKRKILELLGFTDPVMIRKIRKIELITK